MDEYGQVGYNNLPFSDESDESKQIIKAAQQILIRNNRFAPVENKSYVPPGTSSNEIDNQVASSVQVKFGQYDFLSPEETVVFDKLKKIGASLLLKSARFDGSPNAGGSIQNPKGFVYRGTANRLIFYRKAGNRRV